MTRTWGWPMLTTRTCLYKSEFPSPTPPLPSCFSSSCPPALLEHVIACH